MTMVAYNKDIWGHPFDPPASCPRRAENGGAGDEGRCAARRHRAYCRHCQADPATWWPIIAALPPEDRPPRVLPGPPPPPFWPRPDGRPRVGWIVPGWYLGGAEQWHLTLWEHLDRGVQNVGMVIAQPRGVAAAMLRRLPHGYPVGYGRKAGEALARTCDLIVTWGPTGAEAWDRGPATWIGVCQGQSGQDYTDAWIKLQSGYVREFVGVSRTALEALPPTLPRRVIYNGVDPARAAPSPGVTRESVRRAWGIPEETRVIGYLGRWMMADKRADLLPRAIGLLPRDYVAVLVGEGFDGDTIRGLCTDPARTRFLPPIDHAGDALVGFDWLVNPSRHEGFGITMVEAWHAGVPVVAAPTGIAREHPELVRVIDPEATPAELAAAMVADAADPIGTRARAAAARRVARARYSAAAFGRAWSEYLLSLAPARSALVTPPVAIPAPAPAPTPPLPPCTYRGPRVGACGCRFHCMTRSTVVTREVCDLCELA